jgi:prepilin-type N-terminal cleavage/methylation domain-containing protein
MIKNKQLIINSSGVTLIELLIVVAVMLILMGVSFVGYKQRGEELGLKRAAYKVMADIEQVRETAMSSQKLSSGDVPKGGWGIHFNTTLPNEYIIFADKTLTPNHFYDSGTEGSGTDGFKKIVLDEDNRIEISLLSPTIPPNSLDVVFLPPSPDVFINGFSPSLSEAKITVRLSNYPSKTKTIIINSVGLITISN